MDTANLFFVDSNLVLYAFDARDAAKQRAATRWLKALWDSGRGRISWQVLHEFYCNSVRLGCDAAVARESIRDLLLWDPVGSSSALLECTWTWLDNSPMSYWDGLILAAATLSDSRYLLSEDFQTGRKFDRITVINPFLSSPSDFGLSEDDHQLV